MRTGNDRRTARDSVVAAVLGVLLLGLAACTSSEADDRGGGDGAGNGGPVEVTITPEDGATGVATSGELEVTAEGGSLTGVTVTSDEGEEVPGELSEDGARWEPSEHLANGAEYTVEAVAENGDGEEETATSTFTTVEADATFTTNWNIPDESVTGVGMILSLTFDTPIENTEAVEDAVRISADPEVEVRGHWFGNQRLDFRPQEYWEPGTEVSVSFRLRGVEGAEGVYGTLHEDIGFTIGRSQISTVDVNTLTMDVVRDGETIRTLPVTTGAPGYDTWNGKMVITERLTETRMDGATVGYGGEYDIPDVPHAMRLSTSGTFIHGNYWSGSSTFGNVNASHGCIGLEDVQGAGDPSTPGAWFFENSLIGDVVEVVNSNDDIIAPDNGLSGWNMDWSDWGANE
ncbi:Ig-like domain-containing protein [Streptomyces sp. 7-21]|uniref:L,D-transpeptidase n=1 Tax=Streptomyces sp. 7-21 TaxID=2802283 RepID=UPI00191CE7B4|nr:Ig-like domain-containing protein [Streptomyces sp. 7-21]MBL1065399.1 L,D-transpeptidase family protein [Streptomyces sp. 7-21]